MQRAGQIWPIWLLLLPLLLLQVGHQSQATADCMKNPFASVCRGISAKRSGVPMVTAEQKQQQRLVATSQQQQVGQRANELADLLNKLNSLNQQQQQGASQLQLQPPPSRPLAELLVRHWAASASGAAAGSSSPVKTMWPVALGDFLYYERQPSDSMSPYVAPVSSFGIGATGNE